MINKTRFAGNVRVSGTCDDNSRSPPGVLT